MTLSDHDTLARRLAAAYLSYQLGNTSIDYTLKTHVPVDEPIGSFWIEVARLVSQMAIAARQGKTHEEPAA